MYLMAKEVVNIIAINTRMEMNLYAMFSICSNDMSTNPFPFIIRARLSFSCV